MTTEEMMKKGTLQICNHLFTICRNVKELVEENEKLKSQIIGKIVYVKEL